MRRWVGWPVDTAVAVSAAVVILVYRLVAGSEEPSAWTGSICLVVGAAAVAARRRRPLAAAAALSSTLALVGVLGQAEALDGPWSALVLIPFDLAYGLGSDADLGPGLAGVVLLIAGLQATSATFNPLFEVVAVGAWAGGRIAGSRRRIVARIEQRNEELVAERARHVAEQVRLERARIARDLHDIVAHRLSLIVVQAAAARRAPASRSAAADALDCIVDAAGEAGRELARLASPAERGRGIADIDELVRHARAGGVTVSYRASDVEAPLPGTTAETAYRVVQEALTNAVKHAPGAQVGVVVREIGRDLDVEVTTSPIRRPSSGLEESGSGRGLTGLRERVTSRGGFFSAGPTEEGGWRVSAVLPAPARPTPGS